MPLTYVKANSITALNTQSQRKLPIDARQVLTRVSFNPSKYWKIAAYVQITYYLAETIINAALLLRSLNSVRLTKKKNK